MRARASLVAFIVQVLASSDKFGPPSLGRPDATLICRVCMYHRERSASLREHIIRLAVECSKASHHGIKARNPNDTYCGATIGTTSTSHGVQSSSTPNGMVAETQLALCCSHSLENRGPATPTCCKR